MARYKKPRKLNLVSITLVLAGIAALYCAVQFGPAYWRQWKVKGILSTAANKAYPKRFSRNSDFLDKIEEEAIDEFEAAGIEDERLTVSVEVLTDKITASADYREYIHHPFVGKTTVLWFRPHYSIPIKGKL